MFLVDIQLTQRQKLRRISAIHAITEWTKLIKGGDAKLLFAKLCITDFKLSTARCVALCSAAYDSANLETNSSLAVYNL